MSEIEYERTYLAGPGITSLLDGVKATRMVDVYIPEGAPHPSLRVRRKGGSYEITKKVRSLETASIQEEFTITLTEDEFTALSSSSRLNVVKDRYVIDLDGRSAEVDVFRESLEGLVLVDLEFASESEMNEVKMPEHCIFDVSEYEFIAGGKLAGKSFKDISKELEELNYVVIKV